MKFIDLIKLATRMFKARTSRTLLTILGIGVGMATILFLVSLGFGVQGVILSRITTPDSLASIDVYSESDEHKKIDWDTIEKIKYIKEVDRIVPLLKYQGQVKIDDYSTNAPLFLTRPGYLSMDGKKMIAGKSLDEKDKEGVVLSSSFTKVLSKEPEDFIGKKLDVILHIPGKESGQFDEEAIDSELRVIGVVEDEKSQVYLNLDGIQSEMINEIALLKVKTKKPNQVEEVKQKIGALGYKTSSVSEVVDQTKKFFGIASSLLAVLGVVALVVSSIGMFNTMVVTLLERTEEIGIMKAIGATDKNILSIFVVESAVIGFLGGLTGVVLGSILQNVFNFMINFIAVRMGGGVFDLFHSPAWFVLLLIGASLLIGVVTGWIPAKKASLVDPLEALRRR